jgi:hypothetical protein
MAMGSQLRSGWEADGMSSGSVLTSEFYTVGEGIQLAMPFYSIGEGFPEDAERHSGSSWKIAEN